MASLTWVGGGNNRADNQADWSAHRTPELGDTLMVTGAPGAFTMNIRGNDLRGDPLAITGGSLTANLSGEAIVNAGLSMGSGTFNVTGQSRLNIALSHAGATVNLSGGSSLDLNPGYGNTTVSVNGHNYIAMEPDSAPGGVLINLAPNAQLTGTLTMSISGISLTGGASASFENTGNSTLGVPGTTLDVNVMGHGTVTVPVQAFGLTDGTFNLQFLDAVAHGQDIQDGGSILIQQPTEFLGRLTLTGAFSQADLAGINADSFTFANGLLKLYAGTALLDETRLVDHTPNGFAVVNSGSGSTNIVALSSSGQTIDGALPLHQTGPVSG